MTWTLKVRGDSTGHVIREYDCADCGRFEQLERRADEWSAIACPDCARLSPLVLSAPRVKTVYGYAATTVSGKERPGNALDTRALADGMPLNEWKARRHKVRQETLRKRVKAAVS